MVDEDDALEFAQRMGGEHPPTNTDLIDKHIDWWEENYPEHADIVREWYTMWQKRVDDEDYEYKEFDQAYHDFTDLLKDLGVSVP